MTQKSHEELADPNLPSDMGLCSQLIPVEALRTIVVRETMDDRVLGAVAWNPSDPDAEFGDVEPLENVVKYPDELPQFSETVSTPAIPITSRVPVAQAQTAPRPTLLAT